MSLTSPRTLAILWSGLILVGLTVPGSSLPSTRLFEFDKLIHGGLFLVLTLLWLSAVSRGHVGKGAGVLTVILAFSVLSELYQGWLPFDRTPDFLDSAADAAGAVVGFLIWLPLRRGLDRWSERSLKASVQKT